MIDQTLAATGKVESFGRSLHSELNQVFGLDFELWHVQPDQSWQRWSDDLSDGATANCAADCPIELMDLFDDEEETGAAEPQCWPVPGGDGWLVIPVCSADQRRWCAAICLSAEDQPWALRLARVFSVSRCQQQQLRSQQQEIQAFALQVSDDFEELTFLRELAQRLDYAEVSRGAWFVAEAVLPMLASIAKAETLVLVPAKRDPQDSSCVHADALAAWSGPRLIDETTCLALVDRYRNAARLRPVVLNHLSAAREQGLPEQLHELVLVQIAGDKSPQGWLLAMNCTLRSRTPAGSRGVLGESEFGTVEASLLTSVASILATHGRNVALFQEKEQLLANVVRVLVSALEARDPYTCGHSERVALYARQLAAQLQLPPAARERFYLTGLLHDIGKIGISDVTLGKPGALTPEEFAEIQKHPQLGWDILHDLEQLQYVLPGVLHHHERIDGRGYPAGLAGTEIPLEGRLLAVADAYDAMTSDRPYRAGMSHEKAQEILRSGAGTQWDADITEAFLRIADQIVHLKEDYQRGLEPSRRLAQAQASKGYSQMPLAIAPATGPGIASGPVALPASELTASPVNAATP